MFEQMASAAQKANSYTHLWITQRLITPVYDVKNPETEVAWMLAEKLAQRGFTNLLDYYKTEFKDPETGVEPTTGLELELYAYKLRTLPIWNPASYEEAKNNGDMFNNWQEFIDKGVWNSSSYKFKGLWSEMKTETTKFEFYSETLKKALLAHAEKHNTDVDDILKTCKYTVKGELAFLPHYEEPYMEGKVEQYPFAYFF